jgi:hypothetical protein
MASSTSDRVTPLQLQTYIQHFSESKDLLGDCEAAAELLLRADAPFCKSFSAAEMPQGPVAAALMRVKPDEPRYGA